MEEVETTEPEAAATEEVDFGRPRGTLAISVLYGVLFALGWMGMFFFEFMPRGTPHP